MFIINLINMVLRRGVGVKMELSIEAQKYLANNEQAREILSILNLDGSNVLGSWYSPKVPGKSVDERIVFGSVSLELSDDWFEEHFDSPKYGAQDAKNAESVVGQMCDLGILELNSIGWCGSPVKYALKGEWEFKRTGSKCSYDFKPDLEGRAYLSKLITN